MAKRYNDHGLEPFLICQEKKEYVETLLDGFILMLNPFAERPFPLDTFRDREISIHYFDPDTNKYLVNSPHGFLFQRSCMGFLTSSKTEELKRRVPNGRPMMPHASPPWKDGELHKVSAYVGPFENHFMAHFEGWTILIAHDPFDSDWGAQAISEKVKTIPRFVELNESGKPIHVMADEFYATKEQALEAIQLKISEHLA